LNKPVDGHAPGLRGQDAQQYFSAGITTDHECFTYEEGLEKARLGVKILIREGSAARNFEVLWPLLKEFPQQIMFCSDDKHPDDLIQDHINQLAARAVAKGCNVMDVLRAACLHPVEHYRLPVGLLREGDPADFILVEDLINFSVKETWLAGKCVARNGQSLLPRQPSETPNHFFALPKTAIDFQLKAWEDGSKVRVIQALDGEIVTEEILENVQLHEGFLEAVPQKDLLKIAVVNRYEKHAPPAIGFVRGFGLKKGALASSVAHDSHNIVAVGTDDDAICDAVNAIIEAKGGISATNGSGDTQVLPLPIAGLMSPEDGYVLAQQYATIDSWVKRELGCQFRAPFMVLSFLALPVIPALKITDKGLFDVCKFDFVKVSM
jgi:adenine deaminase